RGWAMPPPPAPPGPPALPEKPAPVEPQPGAAKELPPAPEPHREQVIAQELQKFHGTWVATDPYLDDKKLTEPPPAKGTAPLLNGRPFTFTETHCTDRVGASFTKYLYKVDPTKSPKEIDLIPVGSEGKSAGSDKLIKGIYAFDGDRLTISWFPDARDRKRPT